MPPIRLELLGTLRITFGDTPVASVNTARMQSLLAYLVLHADAPQSREHLAYLLWPESEESQARTNLRQVLHHLRKALPADCSLLAADNQTVQWRHGEGCTIDVFEFEGALATNSGSRNSFNDFQLSATGLRSCSSSRSSVASGGAFLAKR